MAWAQTHWDLVFKTKTLYCSLFVFNLRDKHNDWLARMHLQQRILPSASDCVEQFDDPIIQFFAGCALKNAVHVSHLHLAQANLSAPAYTLKVK